MRHKPKLTIVGTTPEGLRIVSGVFVLVDTHGIPLELILDDLKEHSMMPDWVDFYQSAVKAGWKPAGVVVKLAEAIGDVYGPAFRDAWQKSMADITN